MGRIKNISGEAREVPLLGRTVEADEEVDVADELLAEFAWPESTWKVSKSKKAAEKAGEGA